MYRALLVHVNLSPRNEYDRKRVEHATIDGWWVDDQLCRTIGRIGTMVHTTPKGKCVPRYVSRLLHYCGLKILEACKGTRSQTTEESQFVVSQSIAM